MSCGIVGKGPKPPLSTPTAASATDAYAPLIVTIHTGEASNLPYNAAVPKMMAARLIAISPGL